MTIHLRPHHLLCLLTYVGKGYGDAFIRNYDRIAQRLSMGEAIMVVDGPDDICAALLCEPGSHCFRDSVVVRDRQAAADVADLLELTISAGTRIDLHPALLARMRKAFTGGSLRKACGGCEWSDLCSGIAADGYGEVRVRVEAEVPL